MVRTYSFSLVNVFFVYLKTADFYIDTSLNL